MINLVLTLKVTLDEVDIDPSTLKQYVAETITETLESLCENEIIIDPDLIYEDAVELRFIEMLVTDIKKDRNA